MAAQRGSVATIPDSLAVVKPLLRATATAEIDDSAPIEQVVWQLETSLQCEGNFRDYEAVLSQ
jgi:hypothetical protein